MMSTTTWVMVAGLLHGGVLAAAAMVPVAVPWRAELERLSSFTRQLVWTHAGYVAMTIAGIGLVSVIFAEELTDGTPLARAVCGYAAAFWSIRLGLSVWMHPAEHLTSVARKLGYAALLVTFACFTVVYAWVAIGG